MKQLHHKDHQQQRVGSLQEERKCLQTMCLVRSINLITTGTPTTPVWEDVHTTNQINANQNHEKTPHTYERAVIRKARATICCSLPPSLDIWEAQKMAQWLRIIVPIWWFLSVFITQPITWGNILCFSVSQIVDIIILPRTLSETLLNFNRTVSTNTPA